MKAKGGNGHAGDKETGKPDDKGNGKPDDKGNGKPEEKSNGKQQSFVCVPSKLETYALTPDYLMDLTSFAEYEYDAADRMTAAGGTSYTYDRAGRLSGKSTDEGAVSYRYDALSRLIGVANEDETSRTPTTPWAAR